MANVKITPTSRKNNQDKESTNDNANQKPCFKKTNGVPKGMGIALGIAVGAMMGNNIAFGLAAGVILGGIGVTWRKKRGQDL